MANRRMFSLQIVDTDAFLEMPMSSQLLYFHLAMRADDEGFVGNPKRIVKMVGGNDDDFKILIAKRFLLAFESGVVVIKHWLIHNTIRMDRFSPTSYKDEKNGLIVKENKSYTELATSRQPNGNQLATQVKLSKDKLRKDNIIVIASGKPSAHTSFIKFFDEQCRKVRGVKPIITGKDGKNLKRVLELNMVSQQELEQLALYFLSDQYYKKFAPSISTFLSSGILNGLVNSIKNRPTFWKELDNYMSNMAVKIEIKQEGMVSLADRLAKMKEAFLAKSSQFTGSKQPYDE